jgi:hypothetical protein
MRAKESDALVIGSRFLFDFWTSQIVRVRLRDIAVDPWSLGYMFGSGMALATATRIDDSLKLELIQIGFMLSFGKEAGHSVYQYALSLAADPPPDMQEGTGCGMRELEITLRDGGTKGTRLTERCGEIWEIICHPKLCDICGAELKTQDAQFKKGNEVAAATTRGYTPTKLQMAWKRQCEILGISSASHWTALVKMNGATDWGLCRLCWQELDGFAPEDRAENPTQLDPKLFAVAAGYAARFEVAQPSLKGTTALLKQFAMHMGLSESEIVEIATASDVADVPEEEKLRCVDEALKAAKAMTGRDGVPTSAPAVSSDASIRLPKKHWWKLW